MNLAVAIELDPWWEHAKIISLEEFDPIGTAIRRCRVAVRDAVRATAGSLGLAGFEPAVLPEPPFRMGDLSGMYVTSWLDGVLIRNWFQWTPERPHAWFKPAA